MTSRLSAKADGTQGYAEAADALARQYESVAFADLHRATLPLMGSPPGRVLDIGAGTGRDAAGFAGLGYAVTAVEPTDEFRAHGRALHSSAQIEWIDDSLPALATVRARSIPFDIILMTAVWMHLDAPQRKMAMPNVALLLARGGILAMSLRHGPVPPGRRMFEVSADETIALAAAEGLRCVQSLTGDDSLLKRPDVTWDRLVFRG